MSADSFIPLASELLLLLYVFVCVCLSHEHIKSLENSCSKETFIQHFPNLVGGHTVSKKMDLDATALPLGS